MRSWSGSAKPGESDSLRAWRPWVLEEADGTLRMWYTGDDGTTSKILTAVRPPGETWGRPGIAIDAGFAGDTDSYGAESACVVKTPGGYLMVYGGFDGEVGRLHMATSDDSHRWDAQGTIMQRGPEDAGGANHPCLLLTGERWWLFFTGYPGSSGGQRSVLVAAVSQTGASWDRVGTVLEPEQGEVAVSHPCVLEVSRTIYLFYASDVEGPIRIAMATSSDGLSGTAVARSWNLQAGGPMVRASTPRAWSGSTTGLLGCGTPAFRSAMRSSGRGVQHDGLQPHRPRCPGPAPRRSRCGPARWSCARGDPGIASPRHQPRPSRRSAPNTSGWPPRRRSRRTSRATSSARCRPSDRSTARRPTSTQRSWSTTRSCSPRERRPSRSRSGPRICSGTSP